jgi:hypothetical protein
MGMEVRKCNLIRFRTISSHVSFVITQRSVPLPLTERPLLMPHNVQLEDGVHVRKSFLLLLMQQEALVLMHMGALPGEKFIILVLSLAIDCQADK